MDQKIDKVLEKLETQGNRLTSIEADLRHHVKRSDTLEDLVQRHEKYFWIAVGVISFLGPCINAALMFLAK